MEHLLTADSLIALATLTALEVVLGIDNIVFLSILVAKLPKESQERARKIGLSLALLMRLGLLFSISWLMSLTEPFFHIFNKGFSGRDLILLVGGIFLIGKATSEIHEKLEADDVSPSAGKASGSKRFAAVLLQILLIDLVFSLDSVITAVGMAQHIEIMVIAMVVSVGVMLLVSSSIARFVERHPTIKMLALSFLILIGVMLLMEGMGSHIEKGYIYFAMAFSLSVEMLNIKYRSKQKKHVKLRGEPK